MAGEAGEYENESRREGGVMFGSNSGNPTERLCEIRGGWTTRETMAETPVSFAAKCRLFSGVRLVISPP